jgi:hypothetical protein
LAAFTDASDETVSLTTGAESTTAGDVGDDEPEDDALDTV